jgi:hypothetical protein
VSLACFVTAPVDAGSTSVGREPVLPVHYVQLAIVAALIVPREQGDNFGGAVSLGSQLQAARAIVRIDEGLARHRADSGRDIRDNRAYREETRRHCYADAARAFVRGDDRPRHPKLRTSTDGTIYNRSNAELVVASMTACDAPHRYGPTEFMQTGP